MEALDVVSSIVIITAAGMIIYKIVTLVYKVVTNADLTVTNTKTGKSVIIGAHATSATTLKKLLEVIG